MRSSHGQEAGLKKSKYKLISKNLYFDKVQRKESLRCLLFEQMEMLSVQEAMDAMCMEFSYVAMARVHSYFEKITNGIVVLIGLIDVRVVPPIANNDVLSARVMRLNRLPH